MVAQTFKILTKAKMVIIIAYSLLMGARPMIAEILGSLSWQVGFWKVTPSVHLSYPQKRIIEAIMMPAAKLRVEILMGHPLVSSAAGVCR